MSASSRLPLALGVTASIAVLCLAVPVADRCASQPPDEAVQRANGLPVGDNREPSRTVPVMGPAPVEPSGERGSAGVAEPTRPTTPAAAGPDDGPSDDGAASRTPAADDSRSGRSPHPDDSPGARRDARPDEPASSRSSDGSADRTTGSGRSGRDQAPTAEPRRPEAPAERAEPRGRTEPPEPAEPAEPSGASGSDDTEPDDD